MKLSEVSCDSLNAELIKKIFFTVKKEKYDRVDYVIIYGWHIKKFLDERLEYALEVLNSHEVGKIVLTGGVGVKGNFNEAEYMRDYLINNSIDESKIIIENKSKTTEENNTNIIKLLNLDKASEPLNVVLISHEFHLARIILHWKKNLKNSNIHFYYDYVEKSNLSYERIINTPELFNEFKNQLEKTKYFIENDEYIDIIINE